MKETLLIFEKKIQRTFLKDPLYYSLLGASLFTIFLSLFRFIFIDTGGTIHENDGYYDYAILFKNILLNWNLDEFQNPWFALRATIAFRHKPGYLAQPGLFQVI